MSAHPTGRRLAALLSTAGLALALTACGGSTPSASTSSSGSWSAGSSSAVPTSSGSTVSAPSGSASATGGGSDSSLAALVPADLRSSTVAVFGDWAPEEYVENGEVKGWSVDLVKAMADRLGVDFHYEATGFDAIIPGLGNGRYAAAVASLGVTPERLQTVDFVPLQKEGTAFGWKAGSGLTVSAIEDACGRSVAVLTGAFEYQYLMDNNATVCGDSPMDIQQFKDQPSAELAVASGRVQLVAAGSGKLKYTAKQTGQLEVSDLLINAVYNGVGIPKGSEMGPAFEAALQSVIDDGTYARIRSEWGVTSQGDLTDAVLITEANPEG
ncbi:transporter substrate-binding domain-containing protein [Nakamurella deserti]|uniref:transporter substrate-binding domain-containing protein n=1 Tax=Nakamurella deserti TaxID=2164074 RepID=UPI0013007A3D|nr:transporter substrate-binding domain-containing protein [Nakamurella deserti]